MPVFKGVTKQLYMKKSIFTLSFLALASGAMAQARLQVIHNSADAAAATVDVRVNGGFPDASFDDLSFREATPFITVPAGTYTVTINGPASTDASSPVFTKSLTVVDGETYVVMAAGIVSATGYSPATPFDLFVKTDAQETAGVATDNDILIFHGATDAPAVKVSEVSNPLAVVELASGAEFGDFTNYIVVPNDDYSVQIRTMDQTTVAQYSAPLQTLGASGAALTVMASGFLNPTANSNGAAFGLFAVLADGTVLPLPSTAITTARLQVIHNCASTDAASVGVWVNNAINLIPAFQFRTATPFIDVPANTDLEIDITAPNATSSASPLYTQTINLAGGDKFVAIASGTVGSGTYTPATPFNIIAFGGARESANTANEVAVKVFHGATDAPMVDVRETAIPAGIIVDDLSYGENAGYLDLPNAAFELQIEAGGAPVISYDADLTTLGGTAITVLASGFLDPVVNNNGAGFGLWVALPAGGNLIALPVASGLSVNESALTDLKFYPNPVSTSLIVENTNEGDILTISDLSGRTILTQNCFNNQTVLLLEGAPAGQYLLFNNGLPVGKLVKQ